ncbi:glutaredoxin family protein [Solicola gregarius]|uniref:Glutaredoxin family protein n=1 Tax=Solicola gregarius TaxID=2908642 RepID=A0AA46YMY5_9ACTN|nr:glutaredoxin family protein [Solicola gregarius]UYM06941.1 glutaredoxin family protein [Solicola gregarius]
MSVRVEVLTKPGCHLCEDAVAIVASVCAELGVAWSERDISGDPDAMHTYGEQIPVTFVDGRQHDFWRVDPARLRKALG